MQLYNGKRIYEGDAHAGDIYRQEYLNSVNGWIAKGLDKAAGERENFMPPEKLKENPEYYRQKFTEMIGTPINPYPQNTPYAKSSHVADDEMCKIYRLKIEVMPDFWFYGILSVPHNAVKVPLVIAQHGGGGTPESCCDMAGENNYSNFTKKALGKGMAVFAPQLLLWCFDVETGESKVNVDIPFDRCEINGKLLQLGLSITGLEVFCIRRSIDYLSSLDYVDEGHIGMMGLSYGGYFSLYTAAADLRIKSVYSAASFNNRAEICFKDWMYPNSARTFFDSQAAALCAPRRLQIDVGKTDRVFDYTYASAEALVVEKYYAEYGAKDEFCFNLWDGGHFFDESNTGFDFFFNGI